MGSPYDKEASYQDNERRVPDEETRGWYVSLRGKEIAALKSMAGD
jgi:hypothetical protein